LKYILLYHFGFFYCIYDNYVQLKFRK
ncbi:glycosyl transferase family 2, partial [Streptococcus pneumoniae]|nr:glycosyl transferase family 2 [Streptococcus pneumoniae]